ncbi:MAG: histidinol-phosphate transaminase [Chloroflexi bacterium]|nr:histidinol-phosphate transaminase [Chloroflexota bacterium]
MLTYRKEIEKLPPYQVGGAFAAEMKKLGLTRVVKLNSNEGPLQPFPAAIEAMQKAVTALNRYPDPASAELRSRLAEKFSVPAEGIVTGPGATTLIKLLCSILISPGDEMIIGWPMFPPYEAYTVLMGGTVRKMPLPDWTHDLPQMLDAVTERTRILVICNPNNPTGTVVSRKALDDYFERVPAHVMTIVDEAYIDFADKSQTVVGTEYYDCGKPVMILRSFSKVYGLAGIRLGYAMTSPETANWMRRAQEGFPVSHVAQVAGIASLACDDLLRERMQANAEGVSYLESGFDRLGLQHTRSHANFVFVDVERDSMEMFRKLMSHGVLVRPGKTYDCPTHLRITVGSPEENEIFLDALGKSL